MWCRDLTECLTSGDNLEEAVKGAEQRCFQVIGLLFSLQNMLLILILSKMLLLLKVCVKFTQYLFLVFRI